MAAAKEIDLTTVLSPDLALYADPVRVKQILYNLLIKFTLVMGSVRLAAESHEPVVHISVLDTGIGIPIEEQEAIFETFHRCLNPTQDVCEGTGLGLSITRLLVEQHGGRIWVESEPGKGSQFHLTLPHNTERLR